MNLFEMLIDRGDELREPEILLPKNKITDGS